MSELLASPRFVKRVSWIAGLVLVAGIVAFGVAYFGDTADPVETPVRGGPVPNPSSSLVKKTVPLDKQARVVAGQFILSAVTREDLPKAWKLMHPDSALLDCGGHRCTYKEWLSGNIPVQPFPADALDLVTYDTEESYADQVVLQVALLSKDGSGVKSQIFWISLKKVRGNWLVDEWSPRVVQSILQPDEAAR